jgi:lysophospholipase L1-like esterase
VRKGFTGVRRGVSTAVSALVGLGVLALVMPAALGASTDAGANPATIGRRADGPTYYVSLGDSYSVGYQPSPAPGPTPGYTAFVARRTRMKLVNFGCGGATTTSILSTPGCTPPYGPQAGTDAASYAGRSQAAAAGAFLRAHHGHVGLVTVSIGGNDITKCASATDPTTCVLAAIGKVRTNVGRLATELRHAVGRHVPIIGLTYPDVLLGEWVYPGAGPNRTLATLSVTAFRSLVNPALASAYHTAGAAFVDVTADTGAYTPLGSTTTLAPFGTVPDAVARVCELTWFCTQGNIHAKTAGYDLIGAQILKAYRAHPR